MSIIRVKGRPDPIRLPYERAKKVKQRKFGDDTVTPPIAKASPSDLIDLGDEWSGTYGQITSIELGEKPTRVLPPPPEPEMTPEEREKSRQALRKIGEELGFTGKKKSAKYQLTRSGLNEYKKSTGKDYVVPEGTEIIEDVQ